MNNQKEKVRIVHTSSCTSCNEINRMEECVRCLRLFCHKCIALTPKGASCADCYSALHPESLYADLNKLLGRVH